VTALKTALQASLRPQVTARFDQSGLEAAFDGAKADLAHYADVGVHLVTFFDRDYPSQLRLIPDPPPILFVRGDRKLLVRDEMVAVVGTREPTNFGVGAAESITETLAHAGYVIVSGLAKGIDTIAHKTAVASNAPTIAVMGGGLDRIYPAENTKLADEILQHGGALISEQPFGAPPRPNNLIARDRIQSGMSVAVIVAQSGVKSGTMHTVRYAVEQGRPIFCPVPHSNHQANEGLRVLLDHPAHDLWQQLPAWKSAVQLCQGLGQRPLAHPIQRERLDDFVAEVGRTEFAWWTADQPVLRLPVDH
jgi:DNA processing protein